MKQRVLKFFLFTLCIVTFLSLTACGSTDYYQFVSDERSDLFYAETEKFSLALSCVDREHPFLTDGVVSPRSKTVEITLTEKQPTGEKYEVYLLEDVPRGGEMSFRNVTSDYYYSRGVEEFPGGTVSLRVIGGGETVELAATSVKNEKTLSAREALEFAVAAEKETIKNLSTDGFRGEFHVRLLRRDKNYYYVGIVDSSGGTVSLLLDSETGAVLARRQSN